MEVPSEALVELVRIERGHLSPRQHADGVDALLSRWTRNRPGTWLRKDSRAVWALATVTITAVVTVLVMQWRGTRALSYAIDGGRVERSGVITALGAEPPRLHFSDGTVVRLSPGTKASLGSVDERGAHLSVTDGSAQVDVMHVRGARWLFDAGPFLIAVTGTAFTVEWRPGDEQLDVRMQRGSVEVSGPLSHEATVLGAGQHMTARVRQRETLIRSLENEAMAPPLRAHDPSGVGEPSSASAPSRASSPELSRPPGVAMESKPTSGLPVRASARIGSLAWEAELANGEFEAVIRQAERVGLETCLAEADGADLAALADAARYGRHDGIARRALLAQRRRFPLSPAARDALFLLGRLEETEQHAAEAIDWYDRYLAESAGGTYASEALGRKMNLAERLYGEERASGVAKDYVSRFPQGTYAARARALCPNAVTALRIWSAALAAVLTVAILAATRLARAESLLVVLAPPASGGATATEVLNRLRGELRADGLHVLPMESVPKSERVASLERMGRGAGASVAVGLFVDEGATSVDLCLVDTLTGRVFARRIEAQFHLPEQPPEVLARRTVDLLRASVLDFLVESLRAAVEPAPVRHLPNVVASDPAVPSGWVLESGLGVLASFQGLGPALVPLARVRRALSERMHLRLTGAWLGTQPRVEAATGTASVEQGIALFECVARLGRDSRLHPLFSLGAGTYYVGVTGSGISPYPGARSSEFAFALDAGLGVGTPIASHLEIVVEVHTLVTAPGLAIRFLGDDKARIGRPSLLTAITIAGAI